MLLRNLMPKDCLRKDNLTMSSAACIGVIATLTFSSAAHAQVTPDGLTDTVVTTDVETGRVNVEIAPTFDSRISFNSFTDFNVSAAGLNLDNRLVNARTIVNEVSGSNVSDIQGEIEVLGQRAHVILANRNGITVDGGRFINTGGVALSTGEVSFINRQVAPNIFQVNTVLETGQGAISIEGAGLSGTMDRLDLLSRELRISAAVTNDNDDDRAEIRLYAGTSLAEYDSAIVPTNTASQWGQVVGGNAEGLVQSVEPILVDITRTGTFSASRIFVEVTDLGAGVRFAGDGLATRRDFTITADGALLLDGADFTAATDVNLVAADIISNGDLDAERRTSISAAFGSANLTALTGDITLEDTRITGFSGFEPAGNEGGINLISETGAISIASTDEAIRSDLITFTRDDIEVADDIIITAETTVEIADTVISSAADIDVTAQAVNVSGAIARTVFVSEGATLIEATGGNIVNEGGLFQALGQSADEAIPASLTFRAAGDIVNRTVDVDNLTILFADQDISLEAAGRIVNDTARITSNGAIDLMAEAGIDVTIARRRVVIYKRRDGFNYHSALIL